MNLCDKIFNQYYRDSVELLYMDTANFIFMFQTNDRFDNMMSNNLGLYDTSNFPPSHPCFSKSNDKVMGAFKDEKGGEPITEFGGLKSKMYAYQTLSMEDKRAKGVKKNVLKKTGTMDDYLSILYQNRDLYRTMRMIQSKKHEVYSIQTRKKSLSSFDDKCSFYKGMLFRYRWDICVES